jgi:hypothetical protein
VNATLYALPGTRVLSIPERSPMARGLLLAWLAKRETETPGLVPPAVISDTLAANAAESLTGDRLTAAWADYLSAVREEHDADSGLLTWAELADDVAPGGRHESATDMARCNAAAALAVLFHGEGGR